ncbi:hypothetical protein TWF694_004913 [Orbilia ellipsospora]|uniref:Uncharacterized protein n=1 Tax=Orbilia ellipsospora TaxID=2528407 RepID=A0AAV9WU35_9PEZI
MGRERYLREDSRYTKREQVQPEEDKKEGRPAVTSTGLDSSIQAASSSLDTQPQVPSPGIALLEMQVPVLFFSERFSMRGRKRVNEPRYLGIYKTTILTHP